MTFTIFANLAQEASWSGLGVPAHVARRISAASTLLAALAPAGEPIEIFAPAAVDPARVKLAATMKVGAPRAWDLAWADPAARAVNDRRFALALGFALPGACALTSLAELDAALAGAGFAKWVCKATWTAAGRDRAHGTGATVTGETRARIARLLARAGAVVLEPWCERLFDLGVCSRVGGPPHAPHGLIVDERGGFRGISLAEPELTADERGELSRAVAACDAALARTDYRGPFAIDAFVYRDDSGARRLHALCELNARHTFGHVARALGGSLAFGSTPPPAARVLLAPTADDAFAAWLPA